MNFLINLQNTLISILRILLLSKFNSSKNTKIDLQKDEVVVILANGPSLNLSIDKYKPEILSKKTLVVNLMVCTPLFEQIKPSYYTLLAPQFFKTDNQLSEVYINSNNQLFSNLEIKTTWEMVLFVPAIFKKSARLKNLLSKNSFIKPYYFNTTPIEGFDFFCNWCFSKGYGMSRPHNVLIPAIMNSISLGYKNIYILGADHSWMSEISVTEQNIPLVNQKHFYDENESQPQKMQDYITRHRRLHEIIHKFYLSFKGYWEIKRFADKKKISIYNASEFSMIDAFDRRKLN
ncbi:MAG: hypothetical protein RI883_721 [Bacteroidota bacterium]|jgi:hypothetical protein